MIESLLELPEWLEVCDRYRYDITRFAVEALNMTFDAGQAVTHQQELLFKSIQIPGSRTSVASGHGCFGYNTKIMLSDGSSKYVQDICVDDLLMGDDGKSVRNVMDLARGTENLYRFTYSDGSNYVFNESHILVVRRAGIEKTLTVKDYVEHDIGPGFYCFSNVGGVLVDMPVVSIEPLGEGRYYGFTLDGNGQFLGADGMVLHNTGKSRSAGIIALWHLLFYPESVMLFTAPQIGQLRTVVWKEINICIQRLRNNPILGWLADFIVVLSEKIYIKGFKDTWFVFAKTAPKHQPTNIAGQHGDHYMVWADEACGIDDAVMEVAIGALTHENNRAVLTSQPATNTGFFYDTHHSLSYKKGGIWIALEFNGELSPLVSKAKLVEALYQYGSRNHPGYLIRIRGKFPELKGKFLLTRSEIARMIKRKPVVTEQDEYGYIITVDVGGNVGRDHSVITVAKVVDKDYKGRDERHTHIVDIPLFSNRADINELKAQIYAAVAEYPGATLVIDPMGAGMGLCQSLKAEGLYFESVHWGGPCFNNSLKLDYFNKRAHAYVTMTRAVDRGIFSISSKVLRMYQLMQNFETQMSRLPYFFDEKGRWGIMSKKDMLSEGITSPDIADTLAFIYMERISYSPSNNVTFKGTEKEQEDWDELNEFADAM
ncbi:Hint domain-containing homing endonuclease [Psychrobacter sp. PAMC 21119]|uniref:Hint domain-containing homing endonuclease n=1 Tax=Psychrobacter sp. PAMC 21119 TaxID=1112209 RepID=UPI0002887943|nr:Hint domain-containing homing endonuclease [Psychrobacter sp. PAMC 21119]